MSTRSLTTVQSRWDEKDDYETLCHIYRHYDGYLQGHGEYLYAILKDLTVVNGKGPDWDPEKNVNGPGRLAGLVIARMHEDGHEPNIMGADAEPPSCGQEYHYVVQAQYYGGPIQIRVLGGPVTAFGMEGEECEDPIFEGTVDEFGEFLNSEEM